MLTSKVFQTALTSPAVPARCYSSQSGSGLVGLTTDEFTHKLLATGQRRAYLVYDSNKKAVVASNPVLDEVAHFLNNDKRDFLQHEGVFLEVGKKSKLLYGAFVHKTKRGQAQGGLRYWSYPTMEQFLRDGLRLSLGMGRKCALAGLWWGGGKGIVARGAGSGKDLPEERKTIFNEYGEFLTSLKGCYIGAEDAGTVTRDIAHIFEKTRFVSCIPAEVGGSGNPSAATAYGVVCAMEAALDFLGMGSLKGKKVVMQGSGNVAAFMMERLFEKGVGKIVSSEISAARRAEILERFKGKPLEVILTKENDNSILMEPCDILAPNAMGGILNPETIPQIRAPIVCGAANNQLLDYDRDGKAIEQRGITYVPDFLCNRMGIVNCANEQYGYVDNDPAIHRHFGRDWDNSVYVMTTKVLKMAKERKITAGAAANMLADELAEQSHPIWPHRGKQIIDSLVAAKWHLQG